MPKDNLTTEPNHSPIKLKYNQLNQTKLLSIKPKHFSNPISLQLNPYQPNPILLQLKLNLIIKPDPKPDKVNPKATYQNSLLLNLEDKTLLKRRALLEFLYFRDLNPNLIFLNYSMNIIFISFIRLS